MPVPKPEVLDFLLTRRSHGARTLKGPAPDRAALEPILRAAARSPDHGMLVPWRFLVLEAGALPRIAGLAAARAAEKGLDSVGIEKVRTVFADAPLIVAVVFSPRPSPKVPEAEQVLSAGAVCLALLNAALASGWGAAWITGWAAFDAPFLAALGLGPGEYVAGFVHLGTPGVTPADRDRPDMAQITEWISA